MQTHHCFSYVFGKKAEFQKMVRHARPISLTNPKWLRLSLQVLQNNVRNNKDQGKRRGEGWRLHVQTSWRVPSLRPKEIYLLIMTQQGHVVFAKHKWCICGRRGESKSSSHFSPSTICNYLSSSKRYKQLLWFEKVLTRNIFWQRQTGWQPLCVHM